MQRLAGREAPGRPQVCVRVVEPRRRAAEDLLRAVAEQPLGAAAEQLEAPLEVHGEDRLLRRRAEHPGDEVVRGLQRLLHAALLARVAHGGDDHALAVEHRCGEVDLDGDLRAVLAQRGDARAREHGPGVRRAHVLVAQPTVTGLAGARDEDLDRLPDELVRGPAEQVLGLVVDLQHRAVASAHDERVGDGAQQRRRPLRTGARLLQRGRPVGVVDEHEGGQGTTGPRAAARRPGLAQPEPAEAAGPGGAVGNPEPDVRHRRDGREGRVPRGQQRAQQVVDRRPVPGCDELQHADAREGGTSRERRGGRVRLRDDPAGQDLHEPDGGPRELRHGTPGRQRAGPPLVVLRHVRQSAEDGGPALPHDSGRVLVDEAHRLVGAAGGAQHAASALPHPPRQHLADRRAQDVVLVGRHEGEGRAPDEPLRRVDAVQPPRGGVGEADDELVVDDEDGHRQPLEERRRGAAVVAGGGVALARRRAGRVRGAPRGGARRDDARGSDVDPVVVVRLHRSPVRRHRPGEAAASTWGPPLRPGPLPGARWTPPP